MKTFKGLSLHPHDALLAIENFIGCGMLMAASLDEDVVEIGDLVLAFAKDYANAAGKACSHIDFNSTTQNNHEQNKFRTGKKG